MGFLDRNVDGILALNEMPRNSREQLAFPFVMLDKEKKGGLNYQQFRTLMEQDEMGGAIMSQL
jgi:Ca2+-binding EF-hand superfamily protein